MIASSDTIRLQPIPIRTTINELNGVTAITRVWADGDARRCRLCDACCVINTGIDRVGICTIQTDQSVSDGEAPLFSSRGFDDTGAVPPSPFATGVGTSLDRLTLRVGGP